MTRSFITILMLTTVLGADVAQGAITQAYPHSVATRLSETTFRLIENELPKLFPERFEMAPAAFDYGECWEDHRTGALQRDMHFELEITNATLTVPENNLLTVTFNITTVGVGETDIEVCGALITCADRIAVDNVRAEMDFRIALDVAGVPHMSAERIDWIYGPEQVSLELSDCAADTIANWVIEFQKEDIFEELTETLSDAVRDTLMPMVEDTLLVFSSLEGTVDFADIHAHLTAVDLTPQALSVAGVVDLHDRFPPDDCVTTDPGEPSGPQGPLPRLDDYTDADLSMAIGLGLVDDTLYHMWRRGLTCLTDSHIRAVGVTVDLAELTGVLPGFPSGTIFTVEFGLQHPPKLQSQSSSDALVSVAVDGLDVILTGHLPNGKLRRLAIQMSAMATCSIAFTPEDNGIVLNVEEIALTDLQVQDEGLGFDVQRLRNVIEQRILPDILSKSSQINVPSPIIGADSLFIVPRSLHTTASHLVLSGDFYRKPDEDLVPPSTVLTEQVGAVLKAGSKIHVAGGDNTTPAILLRYEVTDNGTVNPPTRTSSIAVGTPGISEAHAIEIRAVDLHGNRDPSPVSLHFVTDGRAPRVDISADSKTVTPGAREFSWRMSDDVTAAGKLQADVFLSHFVDPSNMLSAVVIHEESLPAGTTSAQVTLEAGKSYNLVVTIRDEAGNVASVSRLYAPSDSATGCAQLPGELPVLFISCGLFLSGIVRRRRRETTS